MHVVVSMAKVLKPFWSRIGCEDSEVPSRAWISLVKSCDWSNWGDVKATYGSASKVGNCVVFNIGGNKFRLITHINYARRKVFVRRILTHKEYDRRDWMYGCGCVE